MGTVATATKIKGPATIDGLGVQAIYEITFDETDGNGETTVDVTSEFSYVDSVEIGGSDATTGYVVQVEKPPYTTALTSTNLKLGVYEAGADAAALDAVASTDLSSTITGLSIKVTGKRATVTSWA